jgi:hypothetical protein
MCKMCEGFSIDDVLALAETRIAEHGFTMQAVSDPDVPDDPTGWVYTMGLLDRAGHPELVVAGVPLTTGARVLGALGRAALEGKRFQLGETIDLGPGIAEVAAVHPVHYELSTFNIWHELSAVGVLHAPELTVLQIVVPRALCPFGDRSWQPLLADPETRLGT